MTMSYTLVMAVLLVVVGVGLISRRIPPAWMYHPDDSALPRDPGLWRTAHVRLGWVLCAAGVFVAVRALVTS